MDKNIKVRKFGGSYELGTIKNGSLDGKGMSVSVFNGDFIVKEGNFSGGQLNGRGTLDTKERTIEGTFYYGDPKFGKINYKHDNSRYKGEIGDFKPHGKGTFYYPKTNTMKEGIFHEGNLIEGLSLTDDVVTYVTNNDVIMICLSFISLVIFEFTSCLLMPKTKDERYLRFLQILSLSWNIFSWIFLWDNKVSSRINFLPIFHMICLNSFSLLNLTIL
jgi:hypothetical protein